MILRAPAKVNLCLRLGPLRSDGYHRLSTLFQAIDLYDEMELAPAAETTVEGFPDDTLVRAALDALGEIRHVRLRKRIPVAAGLSTAEVFAASQPNPIFRAVEGDLIRAMHTVRGVADVAALMANDLQPAVLRMRPQVADALDTLHAAGALAQIVTGSGPTAFGLFEHRAAAEEAAAAIPEALAASPV